MAGELKPCPFCGGEAELNESESVFTYFSIWCKNENCIAGAVQVKDFDKERLVNAWNTRAERTCKMIPNGDADFAATLACSVCGNVESVYAISADEFNYCPNCGAKVVG